MNLFLFDIKMNNLGYVKPEVVLDATVDITINEAFTMSVTVPTSEMFSDDVKFIATPHPKYENEYLVGQLSRKQVDMDVVTYTFREYFYQQLEMSAVSIEKPSFTRKPVADVLNYVLQKPEINWKLEQVMKKDISIYLYYDSGLEVFQRVQEILGGEYVFTCEIDPKSNKLINHKVRYIESQGKKTGRRFERDTNLLELQGDYDYSQIITKIFPRGKGVEVGNEDAPKNAPVGYGRRLTIADVNPQGKLEYYVDKEASAIWGNMYGNHREKVVIYEDITEPLELLDAGIRTLKDYNHPLATYTAKVTEIEELNLGDEVYIIWRDDSVKFEYATRVFSYHYDLVNPANNTLELGDRQANTDVGSALSGMNRRINQAQNVATWSSQTVLGADAGYGNTLPKPSNGREGDTFYLSRKDGLVDMYVFIKGQWIKKASSDANDFGNRGILTGDGQVYYGEVNPQSPQAGDKWYKYTGEETYNAKLHVYDGSKWIPWGGISDANGIVTGTIDANKINVTNLNAANITTGNISANRIAGGTIDASKINVVNLNASSIATGTLDTSKIKVTDPVTGTEMYLTNGMKLTKDGKLIGTIGQGGMTVYDGLGNLVGSMRADTYSSTQNNLHISYSETSTSRPATAVTIGKSSRVDFEVNQGRINHYQKTDFIAPIVTNGAASEITIGWIAYPDINNNEKMIAIMHGNTANPMKGGLAFGSNGHVYAFNRNTNTRKQLT